MSCASSPFTLLKLAGQQPMGLAAVPQASAGWNAAEQSAALESEHPPAPEQHAPSAGQPMPKHVPPSAQKPEQALASVIEHVPAGSQQRPICGQTFGEQEELGPPNVVPAGHETVGA